MDKGKDESTLALPPAKPVFEVKENPYVWDRDDAKRSLTQAADLVGQMFGHIGIDQTTANQLAGIPDIQRRLINFGTDVLGNIDWYTKKKDKKEKERDHFMRVVIGVAIGGVVAVPIVAAILSHFTDGKMNPLWIVMQITTFFGSAFGVLKLIALAADSNGRLGDFWRARADLSEVLYLFEQKWTGQFSMDRLIELRSDLDQAVANARQIVREEQERFFDSIQALGDIVSSASSTFQSVAASAQAVLIARQAAQPSGRPPLPGADPEHALLLAAAEKACAPLRTRRGVISASVVATPRTSTSSHGLQIRLKVTNEYEGGNDPVSATLPDGTAISIPVVLE